MVSDTPLTAMVQAQERFVELNQRAVERGLEQQRAVGQLVRAGVEGVRATQEAGIEATRATAKATPVTDDGAVDELFNDIQTGHDALFEVYDSILESGLDAREIPPKTAEAAGVSGNAADETIDEANDEIEAAAQESVGAAAEGSAESAGVSGNAADEEVAEVADAKSSDDQLERFRAELEAEFEGVGETYAERLTSAGLDTVSALATADPMEIAEAADVSESQAEEWIEEADDRQRELEAEFEGVGEIYADRLASAGIETETQLADASVDEVAEAADVSESRAEEWIDRAN